MKRNKINPGSFNWMTVRDFARATDRFPNQIYDLIKKGNQYGKLKAKKMANKWYVHKDQINGFPFNSADKLRIQLEDRIDALEDRMGKVEESSHYHHQE